MIPLDAYHRCLLNSSLEILAISEFNMLSILIIIKYIVIETTAEK
jgi:hypothetical protein